MVGIGQNGKKQEWGMVKISCDSKGVLVCDIILISSSAMLTFYQENHPEVVKYAAKLVRDVRATSTIITSVTVHGILLATIIKQAPDILTKTFHDGSSFCASESFVWKWLRNTLGYSRQKGTQAAQKLPIGWEDQCKSACIWRAY